MNAAFAPSPELPAGVSPHGLTEEEAELRLAARGRTPRRRTSRSYASIVRANVLTVFNAILAGFGALTLIFGDWRDALFLGVIVANSAIGISQEVRAKRTLDRLSLLVEPRTRVRRGENERELPVEEVVSGDLVRLQAGDQVTADGRLVTARDLQLDESILSGESEPVRRAAGDEVRSGAFVTEGTGTFTVTAVGSDSFAARITGEARSFRHPRSPLERSVNRLLYALVVLVVGLGGLLGYSLYHRHVPLHTAVSTASAGVVSLIPEGLMVLVSLTFAAGAVRMSRRGVLAQQLNAIESLASVDTICIDKTGTLTELSLRVLDVLPEPGVSPEQLTADLSRFAASASARNSTLQAIAEAFPAAAVPVTDEVPFAGRRRWSAVGFADGTLYLGAPGRVSAGSQAAAVERLQREGRRVLAIARTADRPPELPVDLPPAGLDPLGLVVLAEQLRPAIRDTIAFLRGEGVEIKVLSGDAPETVAAIASDVGIPVADVREGDVIPEEPAERRRFAAALSVAGRITPEGKQAVVQALRDDGRYVAMVGDGVNDVPALKSARLAIAQGSGTQMARSVSDLVLIDGDFGAVPALVAEGRRALRNLQRVSKLYVTKSAFAAFLILTIGTSSEAYPLLPRHLTLAAALTIGIPTFFLALAPSTGPWRVEQFVRSVARFAVPSGAVLGAMVVAGYLFALHDLDLSVAASRTVAVTILIAGGLYLVLALEAEGSRRRSTLVAGMCAVLAGMYVAALLIPATREFFELTPLDAAMFVTVVLGSGLTVVALMLCGFSVRAAPAGSGAPNVPT